MTALQRVRVHHPGHRLLVRAHVWRRDVDLRTDERDQLLRVAPRHTLQFIERKRPRIAGHTALGTAIRKTGECALPAHPHGKSTHFTERHIWVKAHTALRGPKCEMMLYPVAHEHGGGAVIPPHGHSHGHSAFGHLQAVTGTFGDFQKVGHQIELLAGHAKNRRIINLGNHVAHGVGKYAGRRFCEYRF